MTESAEHLSAIADRVLDCLARDQPGLALRTGRPVERLPTLDADRLEQTDRCLSGALAELEQLELGRLDHQRRAFRAALIVDLQRRLDASATRRFRFALTPYRGGDLHIEVRAALASQDLNSTRRRGVYLDHVADYARLLREMLAHTRDQAAQGIYLAAAALPGARATLAALREDLAKVLHPPRTSLDDGAARASLDAKIEALWIGEVQPALQALEAFLGAEYAARAPSAVGCAHYPDGEAFYRAEIKALSDSSLDPSEIHRIGLETLAAIEQDKAALRDQLAPGVSLAEFDRLMRDDPGSRAESALDIERCLTDHLRRLEPIMPRWFGRQANARWAVTRADASVEAGMSFGYYQSPTPADPVGRYRYNGREPKTVSLLGAAHLIYHELLPGHHHQLSLQAEADVVHPLQRILISMATIEGWAVYASDLAAEVGAMTPFDLYGHAVMRSFIAARLVVDTGLNALGWSLDRASRFLRENTAEAEGTIATEVLRYATDIPGQALAYGLGARAIRTMRTRAEAALEMRFDVRAFHDELLCRGAYPLDILDGVIEGWIDARKAGE